MTNSRSHPPQRRRAAVLAAIICTSFSNQSPSVDAYSFVSSSHRSKLQYHGNSLKVHSSSRPSTHRQTSASLVMKRPNRRRNRSTAESAAEESANTVLQQTTEMPANLKRTIRANRPTLGHVVPKKAKTRQFRPPSEIGGNEGAQLRPQGRDRDTGRYNNPSNLKILGGTSRGRKLESPQVYLRPMMGKVKEAVYSTLTSFGLYDDVGGAPCKTRHLDIFSGSGSVGLESLSRGAWHCTFVDMSDDCSGTCQRNVDKCGFDGWNDGGVGTGIPDEGEPKARVVCTDAFRALRQPESVGIPPESKFDIVTLCPPYEEIVYADLLEAAANSSVVGEDTVIMVEYPVELGSLPHAIRREDGGVLVGVRNRKYGRTVIAMYVVNPTGDMEVAFSRPEEFITI